MENKTIRLSEVILSDQNTLEDVINYCLDRRIDSIINDIPPEPWVEYTLSDLQTVWDNLNNFIYDKK